MIITILTPFWSLTRRQRPSLRLATCRSPGVLTLYQWSILSNTWSGASDYINNNIKLDLESIMSSLRMDLEKEWISI